MTDYSQNGEQSAILAAFMNGPNDFKLGRFLDIGAYHAKHYSNTRALYELGWSGVMVEPSPSQMSGLVREYGNDPRITLIQAAVGLSTGLVKLQCSDDALSTANESFHVKALAAGYGYYGAVMVPQISLKTLLYTALEGLKVRTIEFASIDIEGGSANLALEWLADYGIPMLPHCMMVEHDFRARELAHEGKKRGYSVALENGENIVLVRG